MRVDFPRNSYNNINRFCNVTMSSATIVLFLCYVMSLSINTVDVQCWFLSLFYILFVYIYLFEYHIRYFVKICFNSIFTIIHVNCIIHGLTNSA